MFQALTARRAGAVTPGAATRGEPAAVASALDQLGDQVDALAADDAGRGPGHRRARPSRRADQRGRAVDLGRLAGRAPLDLAVDDGLDEHLDQLADPLLGALAGQLLDQRRQPRDPLVDDVLRQVVGQALGLGAVLVGVAEHADRVEPGGDQEALELGDVVLGLAGEADDDVAADAGGRVAGADLREQVEEAARCRRSGASGAAPSPRRAGSTCRSTARRPGVPVSTSTSAGRISAGCR